MRPRRLGRVLLNSATNMLSFDTAILISKQLLSAQGPGRGGDIENRGELGVFRLIKSEPVLFDVGGHVGVVYTRGALRR